ncbi:MAG: NAD(P)-binding domain-containing protein, partial [Symbiobacteriaceae bacterium]
RGQWDFDSGARLLDWGAHTVDLCQWANQADDTMPIEYVPSQDKIECRYENGVKLVIDFLDQPFGKREPHYITRLGTCPVRFVGDKGSVETGDEELLAAARRLYEGQRIIVEGRWKNWSPMFMTGQDVYGATLGIIGAGRIGQAVARRARGFDMRILYHNRRPNPQFEAEVGAAYRSLDDLLRESDFVVVLVPLTPETRGLIGARELALMKPTAVLVNAARGPVVDERALYEALRDRRIFAAGLDVFEQEPVPPDHPLLSLPNVTAVPHIGSASVRTRTRMATLAAENLVAALTGKEPPTPVNPEVLGPAWRERLP